MTTMATRLPTKFKMTTAELRKELAAAKPSKYRNKAVVIDGIRFASQAEGKRYGELKLLEKQGVIERLFRQRIYELDGANGIKVCEYVADFVYWSPGRKQWIVEDVKGFLTPMFRLKAKLFRAQYGNDITIIK